MVEHTDRQAASDWAGEEVSELPMLQTESRTNPPAFFTTWAVIATGASLRPDPERVVAKVRHLPCVAVNDAFRIAPWAHALVACDDKWWKANPDALEFIGEKWSSTPVRFSDAVGRMRGPGIQANTNSGLLGLYYAVGQGAGRVLLLGVDMKGSHYFGPHLNRPNTEPHRFAIFMEQFRDATKRIGDCEVINCNPDSALEVFPRMKLEEALEEF